MEAAIEQRTGVTGNAPLAVGDILRRGHQARTFPGSQTSAAKAWGDQLTGAHEQTPPHRRAGAQSVEPDLPADFDVVLISVSHAGRAIPRLCAIDGMRPTRAREVLDSLPFTVLHRVDLADAEAARSKLEAVGGEVSVSPAPAGFFDPAPPAQSWLPW